MEYVVVTVYLLGWVVVSIFYFHPYLERWSNLTHTFQMGWFNNQLVLGSNHFLRISLKHLKSSLLNGWSQQDPGIVTISINGEVDLLSLWKSKVTVDKRIIWMLTFWGLRRSNSADMLPLLCRYIPILRMGLEAKTSHSREESGFLGLCIMSFGVLELHSLCTCWFVSTRPEGPCLLRSSFTTWCSICWDKPVSMHVWPAPRQKKTLATFFVEKRKLRDKH